MRFVLVCHLRRRKSDVRTQHHQSRRTDILLCIEQDLFECITIICDFPGLDDIPPVRPESRSNIVTACEVDISVNGDLVVVEYAHKVIEFQMAGERCCLMANAFHQTTISCDDIRMVINNPSVDVAQM